MQSATTRRSCIGVLLRIPRTPFPLPRPQLWRAADCAPVWFSAGSCCAGVVFSPPGIIPPVSSRGSGLEIGSESCIPPPPPSRLPLDAPAPGPVGPTACPRLPPEPSGGSAGRLAFGISSSSRAPFSVSVRKTSLLTPYRVLQGRPVEVGQSVSTSYITTTFSWVNLSTASRIVASGASSTSTRKSKWRTPPSNSSSPIGPSASVSVKASVEGCPMVGQTRSLPSMHFEKRYALPPVKKKSSNRLITLARVGTSADCCSGIVHSSSVVESPLMRMDLIISVFRRALPSFRRASMMACMRVAPPASAERSVTQM